MAELVSLRPIFKGEEAKLDQKKNVPFQRDQLTKVFEVLGTPNREQSMARIRDFQLMTRQIRNGRKLGIIPNTITCR